MVGSGQRRTRAERGVAGGGSLPSSLDSITRRRLQGCVATRGVVAVVRGLTDRFHTAWAPGELHSSSSSSSSSNSRKCRRHPHRRCHRSRRNRQRQHGLGGKEGAENEARGRMPYALAGITWPLPEGVG